MKNIENIGFKRGWEIENLDGVCCRRCVGLERQRKTSRIMKTSKRVRIALKELYADMVNFNNDGLIVSDDNRQICYR
jgi:hypothetical protein